MPHHENFRFLLALPNDILSRILVQVRLQDHGQLRRSCRTIQALMNCVAFHELRHTMGCAERGLLVVGGIFDGEALGINGALVNGTWRPIPSFEGVQIVHECTNAVVDGSRMYFLPQACYFDAQSWCWETFEPLPGPKRDSVACAVLPDRVLVAVGGRVIDETRTTLWDATARVDAYSPERAGRLYPSFWSLSSPRRSG